jgi:hypothetical protein
MTKDEAISLSNFETKLDDIIARMVTMESLAPYLQQIGDHAKFINGNGDPGAKSRFTAVEMHVDNILNSIRKIETTGSSWAGQHIIQLENENVAIKQLATDLKTTNERVAAENVKAAETSPWKTFQNKYLQPVILFALMWLLFQFFPQLLQVVGK